MLDLTGDLRWSNFLPRIPCWVIVFAGVKISGALGGDVSSQFAIYRYLAPYRGIFREQQACENITFRIALSSVHTYRNPINQKHLKSENQEYSPGVSTHFSIKSISNLDKALCFLRFWWLKRVPHSFMQLLKKDLHAIMHACPFTPSRTPAYRVFCRR